MNGELINGTLAEIDVNKLKPYSRHVYAEYSGKKLEDMINSIRVHGVLESILVRLIVDEPDKYEIIAGHNRVKAAKMAGIKIISAQIREMTDEEADICMVETNSMRRLEILPSEKGRAYKAYLEANNKQGTRNDLLALNLTSGQFGQKSTRSKLAILYGETETQIRRYISLIELIPELLSLVDEKKIPLNSGVNISVLSKKEQKIVYDMIRENPKMLTIAISSAIRKKKKHCDKGDTIFLSEETIYELLNPIEGSHLSKAKLGSFELPPELLQELFGDEKPSDDLILQEIKKAFSLLKSKKFETHAI